MFGADQLCFVCPCGLQARIKQLGAAQGSTEGSAGSKGKA